MIELLAKLEARRAYLHAHPYADCLADRAAILELLEGMIALLRELLPKS